MRLRRELSAFRSAMKDVFRARWRKASFVVLSVLTFLLFIWIPVRLTPGNDFFFQLSIMRGRDFFLFGLLSTLNALLMIMQWHLYRARKDMKASIATASASGAGGLSAVFASMLGTASCSACVAGILGFLGTGSVLFFLKYSMQISAVATMIVLLAVWFAARRIAEGCQSCGIETKCST